MSVLMKAGATSSGEQYYFAVPNSARTFTLPDLVSLALYIDLKSDFQKSRADLPHFLKLMQIVQRLSSQDGRPAGSAPPSLPVIHAVVGAVSALTKTAKGDQLKFVRENLASLQTIFGLALQRPAKDVLADYDVMSSAFPSWWLEHQAAEDIVPVVVEDARTPSRTQ